jgi:ketosteroid isomerase-like protein
MAPETGRASDEVKATFLRFVESQNARDAVTVANLLWDSPDFLWVTTTAVTVWGRDAAMERFTRNWRGTWELQPRLEELRIVELTADLALLHVPLMFTFAPSGQQAQPELIKWSGIFRCSERGWCIATILLATVL